MTSQLQFTNRQDLIRALRTCDWKRWFHESRIHAWDIETVVRVSVGPNTFRYFQRLPEKPSIVFRAWAIHAISSRFIDRWNACGDQVSFDVMLRQMTASLQRTWMLKMGRPMQVGPAIKLPSLLMKHLCASSLVSAGRLHAATRFLHTPLDSYTLSAIRLVHNDCPRGRHALIPNGAGMGWVSTWPQYKAVHATIQDCTAEAKVPAIALDVLAWNQTHPQ